MSKYIDTDLLRKEIEFAKTVYEHPNRVVHGVADAFRQDGRVAMCDDILKKLDFLQQEQPEVDWEAFRREAAKDIFCAMIHHQNSTEPIEVSIAIEMADELIRQLKEEKK